MPLGRWGVVDGDEAVFSLEYSYTEGLVIHHETVRQWWLFLPSPGFDESLEVIRRIGGHESLNARLAHSRHS